MSVGDNVGFGLQEHSKLSAKEIKEIVEEKLNLVGLSGLQITCRMNYLVV